MTDHNGNPIGPKPSYIWRHERVQELLRAIGEYSYAYDYHDAIEEWGKELVLHLGILKHEMPEASKRKPEY